MNSANGEDGLISPALEACHNCGLSKHVRAKLLLIDDLWSDDAPDSRMAFFADFRVDDLKPEHVRSEPMQQFVDGLFCDLCAEGFLPDAVAKDTIRRYYGAAPVTRKKTSAKDRP